MTNEAPVFIVDYDPRWALLFAAERERIQAAIGQYALAIEHGGSTAVPGLAAKPIIDIFVAVRSLTDAPAWVEPLARLGYTYKPRTEAVLPERRYFDRPAGSEDLPCHLHISEIGSRFWRVHLLFRDCLRAQPETARAYADLKCALAITHRNDREAYTDAKTDFIESVIRDAEYTGKKV